MLKSTTMKYRPDIDGLRAIAVLAVLFYHADIEAFSGGYIGVDVFFVISGYLITSKIVQEIKANSFSLVSFYEQRVRRILPALLAVTIFTLLIGAFLFDISSYQELGESVAATTLSLANVLFWTQAGYFDSPSTLKPLLHTWSLAIEEQFYLLLPLLLVVVMRFFKSKLLLILTVFGVVSFGLSIYILEKDPSAVFFLIQYRAWELLFGSLLALRSYKLKNQLNNVLSVLGILMILGSIFFYSEETAFPALAAVTPVLGSALLIHGGIHDKNVIGKILSLPPFVFIGKISYSLYLWHWPLIVFLKFYLIREITITNIIVWLIVVFFVSTLSWKFIETPFRRKSILERPKIFYAAGGVMLLTLTFGAVSYLNETFLQSFRQEPPVSAWERGFYDACLSWGESDYDFVDIAEKCTLGIDNQEPSFLVWGDSHAEALGSAFNLSAENAGITGYLISGSGCPPFVDINASVMPYCHRHNNDVLAYIEEHPEIETIMISARWALYTEFSRYKTEEGVVTYLIDMRRDEKIESTDPNLVKEGLQRTIEILTSLEREVVIGLSVPEIGYMVPSAHSIASRTGRDANEIIAPTRSEYYARNAQSLFFIEQLKKEVPTLKILDPSVLLCDEEICKVVEENKPLYRDDDHLSTFGAHSISGLFDAVFRDIASR